jgi:membrane-associated phospholipid phosphatase
MLGVHYLGDVVAGVHFLLVTGIVLVPMVTGKLDALGPPSRTNW